MSRTIVIHTDGSCLGNPGPGGWATHILVDGVEHELSGGFAETTNNRMEVMAALAAYDWLGEHARADDTITIRFDSEYAMKGSFEWLAGWKARGWQKSTGSPVVNRDLWGAVSDSLASLARKGISIRPQWVRGHNGDPGNEKADRAARRMAEQWRDNPSGTGPKTVPGALAPETGRAGAALRIQAWLRKHPAPALTMITADMFAQEAPGISEGLMEVVLKDLCESETPWLVRWALYTDADGVEHVVEKEDLSEAERLGEFVDPQTGELMTLAEAGLVSFWEKSQDAPTDGVKVSDFLPMDTAPRAGHPVLAVFRADLADYLGRPELAEWGGVATTFLPVGSDGWRLALPVEPAIWPPATLDGWIEVQIPEPAPVASPDPGPEIWS